MYQHHKTTNVSLSLRRYLFTAAACTCKSNVRLFACSLCAFITRSQMRRSYIK